MDFIPTVLPFPVFINKPGDLFGWAGLILFLYTILRIMGRWRNQIFQYRSGKWGFFLLLFIATPITSLFLGIQFGHGAMNLGLGQISTDSVIFILAAIPWILAAGFLGILPGLFLAALSGLSLALWQTHNLYTMPELVLLALFYGYAIHQNFRTPFFNFLRHPAGSGIFFAVSYAPVFILTIFLSTPGSFAVRINEALTNPWPLVISRGIELVLAGILVEFIFFRNSKTWFKPKALVPSPIEQSLELKFIFATVPFLLGLLLSLAISSWVMAKNIAQQIARDSLSSTAQTIMAELPGFLEHGQSQLDAYTNSKLIVSDEEQRVNILQAYWNDSSVFQKFILVDQNGTLLEEFPAESDGVNPLSGEEKLSLALALQEGMIVITASPDTGGDCLISFPSPIHNKENVIIGSLLGSTSYAVNPELTQMFAAINTFERTGGDFLVVRGDLDNIVSIYPDFMFDDQQFVTSPETGYFQSSNGQGRAVNVYFQHSIHEDWTFILEQPNSHVLSETLRIAFPLLLALFLFVLAAIISLVLSLKRVSGSLRYLSDETSRIARGELGANVPVHQVDEVGQLSKSFEQMRSSLRLRMNELNRLLKVSKGVASNLAIEKSIQVVLNAMLETGASSARAVLVPEVTLDFPLESQASYSEGPLADIYKYFDKPIFDSMQHQELLVIPKPSRMQRLSIPEDLPRPTSLIAHALFHEDHYFGAIWAGYEQPKDFSDEELRYFNVLAGQAALAAANAALFCSTEVARQRLEAVLSSAPEPVMVFNENYQLLLINSAARGLEFLINSSSPGAKIEMVINNRELIALIKRPDDLGTYMREIHLENQKVYQAIVSPVFVEKQIMGKVCMLREVTEYKQLEALKSEFVSTVSHDLRSPLTMLKGYATMLPMVGDLNEQQREYLKKITTGLDGMTHLVSNLLDLGRIEAGVGLKLESIQPSTVIEKVIKLLQPQAIQKNIQVTYISETVPGKRIQADPALLQQALFNLIENAIRFNNVGGKVEIQRSDKEKTVQITVSDSGIGIAPIDLEDIFAKFRSTGKSDQVSNGSGLGLSIVKSIIEKHNGKVWVESHLGKGSTFFLEIPIRQED